MYKLARSVSVSKCKTEWWIRPLFLSKWGEGAFAVRVCGHDAAKRLEASQLKHLWARGTPKLQTYIVATGTQWPHCGTMEPLPQGFPERIKKHFWEKGPNVNLVLKAF